MRQKIRKTWFRMGGISDLVRLISPAVLGGGIIHWLAIGGLLKVAGPGGTEIVYVSMASSDQSSGSRVFLGITTMPSQIIACGVSTAV